MTSHLNRKPSDGAKEVPGNTIASQALFDRWIAKQGVALQDAPAVLESAYEDGVDIGRIAISMPTMDKPEYLVIGSAVIAGEHMVAFHNAPTLSEAFVGFFDRLKNRSLKWKTDTYKNR